MPARFEGGGYDGWTFKVPEGNPPRGLDTAFGGTVHRYAFDRSDSGTAVYVFAKDLGKPLKPYYQIDLQADIRAVPLRFYPKR